MTNKILIAAFFAFVANVSSANDFTMLDTDKDGLISKDEASVSQTVTQQWDMLDIDKDGYLGKAELAALGDVK